MGDRRMIIATWKLNLDWIMDIVRFALEIQGMLTCDRILSNRYYYKI